MWSKNQAESTAAALWQCFMLKSRQESDRWGHCTPQHYWTTATNTTPCTETPHQIYYGYWISYKLPTQHAVCGQREVETCDHINQGCVLQLEKHSTSCSMQIYSPLSGELSPVRWRTATKTMSWNVTWKQFCGDEGMNHTWLKLEGWGVCLRWLC